MPRKASRTAVLVCQGRAAAHDRVAPGRFSDPVAMSLLRDDEQELVAQVRDAAPPSVTLGLPRAAGDLGGSLPTGHVLVAERR
jgi:hypothetical protein